MEEDLKQLLEENLKLTREVHDSVVKIRRYMFWQRMVSIFYLVLIIGPLIIAAIYLPPIIKPLWQQYQSIWNSFSGISNEQSNIPGGTLQSQLQHINSGDWQNLLKSTSSYLKGAPKQ
jgi:hypothetical protein